MKNTNKKLIFQIISILILGFYVTYPALAKEINISNVIELVNDARKDKGLVRLSENKVLDKIAADKLEDMVENNYFAHTSPRGVNPWFWYEKNNYDYKYAGENLAINFTRVEDQHKAWMESPTHKKNILNPNYQEIGIAVGAGEINGQTGIITVQEFGTLAMTGGASKEGENFSGNGKENLAREGVKITPQVLSVKDFAGEKFSAEIPEIKNNSSWTRSMIEKLNSTATYNYMYFMALVLMFISITLASVSFLTVAAHEIMICDELRRRVYANHHLVVKNDRILIS